MIRFQATTGRHLRLGGVTFLAILLCTCAMFVTTAHGAPVSLTLRIFRRAPIAEFAGVRIVIRPRGQALVLAASLANTGKRPVTLIKGDQSDWRPRMFDRSGRVVPSPRSQWQPGHLVYLAPGGIRRKTFALRRYFTLPEAGVFYVYVSRLVLTGKWDGGALRGVQQQYVRSAILRLTLRKGKRPSWKIVASVPAWKHRFPARPPAPPYPTLKIPSKGPIATLVAISKEVHDGDLKGVRHLCCGNGYGPGDTVAQAKLAIAIHKYCQALQRRFGADPEKRLTRSHPTPELFSHFLAEIDPATLKLTGHTASVDILWFHGGKFVRMPGFSFRFRQVNGRWLLDQRATYQGLAEGRYRADTQHWLKQAKVFDALTRRLRAGRFRSLAAVYAATDRELAAEGRRTASRPGHKRKTPAPDRGLGRSHALPQAYKGVRISIVADPQKPVVTAIVTNTSNHGATLWKGQFGWQLVASNSHGWGLGATRAQQALWRGQPRGEHPVLLGPGISMSKRFNLPRLRVMPKHGVFYVQVRRIVTVDGLACPISSPVLQLTLKLRAPPSWKVVSTMPQPRLRPPAR